MNYLQDIYKTRLESKKDQLDKIRPISPAILSKIREKLKIAATYNSNAIEGNTLTLKETFLVINEGITVRGKSLKDHLEAQNHYEAIDYLYDIVDQKSKIEPSEKLIREIHKLICSDTLKEEAGNYRKSNVIINGSNHKPPVVAEISPRMNELVRYWKLNERKMNPVELAAIIHHKIVYIHPFTDGNGRTARAIMDLILLRSGYPLAIVLKNDRKKYYKYLSMADAGNYKPFVSFIAQTVNWSLDLYLEALSDRATQWLSLSQLAKKFKLTERHLNLLCRNGKLEAHKEGRIWMATTASVEKYLTDRLRQK
ncbi:MAG: Fic family protein [Minisyncoccia bacterium]